MGYADAVSYIGRCVLKRVIMTAILVLSLSAVSAVADEFTGWISDSKCGVKGASAEHKDCAAKCVKGGAAPVFVMDNKVLKIDDTSKVEGPSARKSQSPARLTVIRSRSRA